MMGKTMVELIWAYREANPILPWRDLVRFISSRTRVPEKQVEACLLLRIRAEAGFSLTGGPPR